MVDIVKCHLVASLRFAAKHIQHCIPFAIRLQSLSAFIVSYRVNNHSFFRVIFGPVSVRIIVVRFITSREGQYHDR